MKSLLLFIVSIIFACSTMGQVTTFTFAGNKQGLETSGESQNNTVVTNADWDWGTYNAKCDGSSGGAAGGGFDFGTTGYFAHAYGFGGDPGAKYLISFGAAGTIADQYYLDLSATANQKVKISGSLYETNGAPNYADVANANFSETIIVELYGKDYNIVATKTITMTNASTDFVIDFSDAIAEPTAMDSIRQVSFAHTNCETVKHSNTYRLYASNLMVGSFATTGLQHVQELLGTSSMYPNPSSGSVTLEVELKAASDLNVELVDVNGKVVQQLMSGNFTSYKNTIAINPELKGIFAVRYLINGGVAKSELLSIQ